jgi:hypothetical protein
MKHKKYDQRRIVQIADRGIEACPKADWAVSFETKRQMPQKTWGICNRKTRILRVRQDLCEVNFLDTLIHELRHAQHPVLFEAEEFISDTSTELAIALLATGRVRAFPKG